MQLYRMFLRDHLTTKHGYFIIFTSSVWIIPLPEKDATQTLQ